MFKSENLKKCGKRGKIKKAKNTKKEKQKTKSWSVILKKKYQGSNLAQVGSRVLRDQENENIKIVATRALRPFMALNAERPLFHNQILFHLLPPLPPVFSDNSPGHPSCNSISFNCAKVVSIS